MATPDALRRYAVDEVLRDGGSIHVRAIRPDDGGRLLDHFHGLSSRSVYFRFLGPRRELHPDEVERFTRLDFRTHVGLVATLLEGGEERIIGVGRSIVGDPEAHPHRAEVAFAVSDAHQGRGIGTILLEHLSRIARANGVTEFEADVLGENNRMLQVFFKSGFVVKRSLEGGVVHVAFPTEETEEFRRTSLSRVRSAAAASIRRLFHPRSVAVVGASRQPGTIGAALVDNLRRAGFRGTIHPVNPKADEVGGLRAFPSIGAVGEPVDLAVITIPAAGVERAVEECAVVGVGNVVVVSAGFAEVSPEGRATQQRITRVARGSGMRVVGPNCIGIVNTDPAVRLNATFAPSWPPEGNVAMLSQSGALGLVILDVARSMSLGISTFASVGNKADVSGNDLLCYWAEDPRTDVIALYLESFGNPRKFARIAPEVARTKPIVAVKSGRSAAGTRAASSHSASLANLDVAVDALFEQAGVIRTNTLEELFDVVSLLSSQPVPAGTGVGVVTNSGGPGILLADACEARRLRVPELSDETVRRLRELLPREAAVSNPVDMIAAATPEQYERTLEIVGSDPAIDSIVVIYTPPLISKPDEIAAGVARGAGKVDTGKPVACVFLSSGGAPAELHSGNRGRLPTYRFPENAALALSSAEGYGRWRRRPVETPFALDPSAAGAVRAVIDRVLEGADGPRWLSPEDLRTILGAAGIDCAASETVPADSVEAATVAERLGYPLVAKAIWPAITHKSDSGGVILGLRSARDVEEAARTILDRSRKIAARLDGILLQREVTGGVEALVGVTTDPTFGPLLVCGLGGTLVELLKDVSFRLTPVSRRDVQEMLDRLRSKPLLEGYRGAPPADREALVSVILRVSGIVEVAPEIRELDLNPVKVLEDGRGAIVVDGRMRVAPFQGGESDV